MRAAAVAGMFYPREAPECRRLLAECLSEAPAESPAGPPRGGLVPHAGWVFSGPTAARVFGACRSRESLRTFVLLGAVHYPGVPRPALHPSGAWSTPLGAIEIDAELGAEILATAGPHLVADPAAHEDEHSLEVQVPFIQHLFPEARIVPILVPPGPDAVPLGQRLAECLAGREDVVTIGSTDLTHYGPRYGFTPHGTGAAALRWVKHVNDRGMLDLVEALDAEAIIPQSRTHQNACGPGAVAATLAAMRSRGVRRATLLGYTTSADVRPEYGKRDFVGYAGVVFP